MSEPLSDMTNEEMDRRFREAAEHFIPPRDPDAWVKMERILDLESPKKAYRKYLFWIIPVAILALLAGGYWVHRIRDQPPAHYLVKTGTRSKIPSLKAPLLPAKSSAAKDQQTGPVNQTGSRSAARGNPGPSSPENRRSIAVIALHRAAQSGFPELTPMHQTFGEGLSVPGISPVLPGPLPVFSASGKKAGLSTRRWHLSLVTGPGLDFVDASLWSHPGGYLGVLAGYSLSGRWQLEAGLIYSTQIYRALPSQYHPKDYSTLNPNLSQIDASCEVIDLPLNIRYNVWSSGKSRFFAESGISSYWMHQENYTFLYDNAGVQRNESWGIKDRDDHPLSILNLSVGFEHQLNDRFSWQVEPFAKLPLSGIGYGRVKLISTGVYISLNYRW
ncbi:MAG TPA: hypothetical protein VNE41_05770 [Chitinophagaceae bacterium]|nr:hypothetical protein [Chitinophagaceae bacterium]